MRSDGMNTLSILVVEDDEAVAELIRAVLNDVSGWGATVVHNAAAARAVFQHVRIEVLVLDVNLPGISGLELLELLRAGSALGRAADRADVGEPRPSGRDRRHA